MGKFYNKITGADYINKVDHKNLLDMYNRLSKFYDNNEIPFENVGIAKETQVKTHFDEETKTFMIAFECSRGNRVQTKFKIAIDWIVNFIAFPSGLLRLPVHNSRTKNFVQNHMTHSGFSAVFLAIINYLKDKIDDVKDRTEIKHFEIYGWSYGGAMATLCHGWLKNYYNIDEDNIYTPTCNTITIGAPRVFCKIPLNIFRIKDSKKLKKLYKNLYMFGNTNDIVTRVPPLLLSYRHIMPVIRIENPFNLIKLFKPNTYHTKANYDKIINEYLSK